MNKYFISYSGRTGGPEFNTLAEAKKALQASKREDKAACQKRYGVCKVRSDSMFYAIEFGCNLFNSGGILSA